MQKTTNNPRDYCFNYIVSRYPKLSHEVFGFPGKFIKSLDRIAYKEDGSKLELDIAELVEKDEFIKQKSTINVEHQTTPIEYGKIDPIYDYKIHLIHENNLPSISIVITSIEQEKQMKCYESQNNVFNVYYIEVKEKDICEKLNILRNITNSEEISQKEAIYFPYIVIFVDKNIDKRMRNIFNTCLNRRDSLVGLNQFLLSVYAIDRLKILADVSISDRSKAGRRMKKHLKLRRVLSEKLHHQVIATYLKDKDQFDDSTFEQIVLSKESNKMYIEQMEILEKEANTQWRIPSGLIKKTS